MIIIALNGYSSMAKHMDFGRRAEDFIAQKYLANGYTILERNWYNHPAELDIIATRDDELVVVEVKARAYEDFSAPEDAVNLKKKRLIVKATNDYMEANDIQMECRFDIAVVILEKDGLASKILVDAFQPYELD